VDTADLEARRARFDTVVRGVVEPLRRFLARRTDAAADDVLADTLLVHWRRYDDRLGEALAALSAEDAELLRLWAWAWEQQTPGEIAKVLDVTENAAALRLHRARGTLRDRLRKIEAVGGHEGRDEGRRP
jgi:RNA polymerase sigma-70 factor, ECF subfamily